MNVFKSDSFEVVVRGVWGQCTSCNLPNIRENMSRRMPFNYSIQVDGLFFVQFYQKKFDLIRNKHSTYVVIPWFKKEKKHIFRNGIKTFSLKRERGNNILLKHLRDERINTKTNVFAIYLNVISMTWYVFEISPNDAISH